jgi:hypothetical protein
MLRSPALAMPETVKDGADSEALSMMAAYIDLKAVRVGIVRPLTDTEPTAETFRILPLLPKILS